MKQFYLFLAAILLVTISAKSQERYGTFILLSMPSDEVEFKNIFKRTPTNSEVQNISSLLNEYKGKPNVYVLKKAEDIDNLLTDLIKKWNDEELRKKYGGNYIPFPKVGFSIVGHNEGGDFYFPNGKSSTLREVEAKLQGYPAMFLSCNAKDFVDKSSIAVDFKLTYSEALSIAEDLENIAPSCIGLSKPRDIAEAMIKKLNLQNKVKYTAKFIGAGGALSATFILLKQADVNDENIPKADSTSLHYQAPRPSHERTTQAVWPSSKFVPARTDLKNIATLHSSFSHYSALKLSASCLIWMGCRNKVALSCNNTRISNH